MQNVSIGASLVSCSGYNPIKIKNKHETNAKKTSSQPAAFRTFSSSYLPGLYPANLGGIYAACPKASKEMPTTSGENLTKKAAAGRY